MSAFVYANGQYHLLAGNKIVKDAALLDMKATDKIIVNGQSYNLGAGSVTPEIPEVPDAPTLSDMVHENGTEPATGTKWYITPDGAGSMDGSSWANAASQSQIHVILLSCASGDSVYFSEGDYTTDRTLTLPSGVSIFGGFPSENPSWETRNAFTHQTVWSDSHSGAWLASTSNIAGQVVDGFTLMNYVGTTEDGQNVTFKNMTLSGGSFTTAGKLENCYVTGVTLNAGSVSSCKAVNSPATITETEGTDFYYASVAVSGNAEDCNVYGTEENKVNCRFSANATNCTAVNCTDSNYDSYIFYTATNCTVVSCTADNVIFYRTVTNCTVVNCAATRNIFALTAKNCTAVNCTAEDGSIFYSNSSVSPITNCTAVNCTATSYIFYKTSQSNRIKNCLSWNNDGTEFSDYTNLTTCAGSTYNSALALTLGTDNSIARFTNTGFAPAKGVQDVGACPSPIDDPDGYAEWLSAFGDWHPAADSFLLGAGTALEDVTTDADGVTRPDPPSIGAFEAKTA